jgi:DNA-binding NarL/FixJ family response regulator
MIRILLADDQNLLCEILQTSLEAEPDLEVVGRANNGEIALEKIDMLRPDIVLIDINMPVMNGLTATEKIIQNFPETQVIVLSGSEDKSYYINAINAGAKSYISKTATAKEITEQVRKVYRESHSKSPEIEVTKTIMQLNQTKQEIQSYLKHVQQHINHLEHTEVEIKQYVGKVENEHEKLSKEVVDFKSNVGSMIDELQKTVKESKQHSREINRIQTLVEGQLSYVHNINKRIKYFYKYLFVVSAVAVIALIVAIIGLFF